MKKKIIVLALIIITLAGGLLLRIFSRRHLEKQTRFVMDTYVTIYAVGPKQETSRAIKMALDRIQEIDVKFNHLNPQSPLNAFNLKGTPITDPELLKLIRTGLEVSRLTDGAFDMSVTPLMELWGFYSQKYRVPAPQEIKECLKKVGYKHLLLTSGSLTKDMSGVKIDLGGIAKGYAISEAVRVLKAQGIKAAIVDAGGDIYALGRKSKNKLWNIGIKNPRGEELLGYIETEDRAVIGSGDYERFFIKDGKRYHHIFNSKTGYSTEGITGVTIVYPDPILSQVWAKIPFIMGRDKGLAFIGEKMPDMQVIVVSSSGQISCSDYLKQNLKTVAKEK